MKRFFAFTVLILAMLLVSITVVSAQGQSTRYTILLKSNNIPANFARSVENAGGTIVNTIPQVGIVTVASSNPNFATEIRALNTVSSVGGSAVHTLPQTANVAFESKGPTATDDIYNGGLVWGVDRVHAPQAWTNGYSGSHNTVVAVIDTGIAWNHPDLTANVVYVGCVTGGGAAQFFAWGQVTNSTCNPYPSLSDHGTHVSGTVAAAFDGGRVVGVGPNLGLAGYNTFEEIEGCGVCSYSESRWVAMIDAADHGFDVISMSLGGTGQLGGPGSNGLATFVAAEQRVANYVSAKGTVMVASAGNSALNLNGTIVHVPGDVPGIINVSATGIRPNPRYEPGVSYDVIAFFSNYGAPITIAAPGGDCGLPNSCGADRPANWFEYLVLSSIVTPSPKCAERASCPTGYGWKAGTSMATPHVSGVAGLVSDVRPDLSANQITAILKQSAEALGNRQLFGAGMVRADLAVQSALGVNR